MIKIALWQYFARNQNIDHFFKLNEILPPLLLSFDVLLKCGRLNDSH